MENNDLTFEFAPTGGGDITGARDPLTTIFSSNEISYSLARESIQNIIDARDPNKDLPAKAEFSLVKIEANKIPGIYELKKKLESCYNSYKRDPDYEKFYKSAIFKIDHNEFISALKISDYNTIGLSGTDDDENGNYFSFLKMVGGSTKKVTEGGSFGLGKGAYFAASSFRTIFVSSVYDADKYVFQGKARLSSHKEDRGWIQGNGSFGLPGQKPVRDYQLIPKDFIREDQGTDIYVLGFFESSEWKTHMVKSVLNHFWLAVLKNLLVVDIEGITIRADNIEEMITEYFREEEPDRKDDPNPWPYFRAYLSEQSKVFSEELPTLGKVELRVLLAEGYPKRVAYIRQTGMVIERKTFSSPTNYAGVFVCDNEEGNAILRKMENPEHNQWNKINARESEEYSEKAVEVEKELRDFIKKSLNEALLNDFRETASVGGLEEFLYLPSYDEGLTSGATGASLSENTSLKETGVEITAENQKVKRISESKKMIALHQVIEGGSGAKNPIIDGLGDGRGPKGPRLGEEESLGKERVLVRDVRYRSFAAVENNKLEHILVFKGSPDRTFDAEIFVGTDDSFNEVEIESVKDEKSNNYHFSSNKIFNIKLNSFGGLKLEVTFKEKEKYSLSLMIYEAK